MAGGPASPAGPGAPSGDFCVIIPAVKKEGSIPDQLVKKLAGVTLIQRALNKALRLTAPQHILVVTDSQEISLIAQRNGVPFVRDADLRLNHGWILKDIGPHIQETARRYPYTVIYRPTAPLIYDQDIRRGLELLVRRGGDILVTLRPEHRHFWRLEGEAPLLWQQGLEREHLHAECKAFMILGRQALTGGPQGKKVVPFILGDQAVEIASHQDWWVCERLLRRKRVLFVTQGNASLGLGHVYRCLLLAHEISEHQVLFLCTSQSEIAYSRIASFDYQTFMQEGGLAAQVLSLNPDLVINDILDTSAEYVEALRQAGIKVVNFEDNGPGALAADLVFNALYEDGPSLSPHLRAGHQYFCLRDEFEGAQRRPPAPEVREVLITFGGTDPNDFTRQTLETLLPLAQASGIRLNIVTGPGYQHKAALLARLNELGEAAIGFSDGTRVISSMMERADLAISSAGRTVLELVHMQKPCIIMSHHAREHSHSFARPKNGVVYLGVMAPFKAVKLRRVFTAMLGQGLRQKFYERMTRFDFSENKERVLSEIWSLLEPRRPWPAAPARKALET
ncbi:MAG: cytidine 5'-phosphate N-acetylneuraminic acid synthetase [Desulfarculus sp.]|nr:cytidine 5'-phosphate N-acetylneuraminic acid synthetase [Desulfarculus sp.]